MAYRSRHRRQSYRPAGYYSHQGSEYARRHVEEAEAFSREIGGTDSDVKNYFFSLSSGELDALLTEYGLSYGADAESYARETFTSWKSGRRRMSGLVAKRLFSLLPRRMPLALKYELAGNVWRHFGPSSSHAFVVGVETPVEEVAQTVARTLDQTVTSYSVPSNVANRFDWLAAGDVKVKEQLLNYFRQQEKKLAIEKVRSELPILQRQVMNHAGVTKLARSVLQVHKHQISIRVHDGASSGVELDANPTGSAPSSYGDGSFGLWWGLALIAFAIITFILSG